MSTIKANAYLDAAGGNTATINGATPVGTDTTQTLTNKSIDAGQLTGDVAAARITTALNASGSAPIYACRAWVNFSGTSSPGTIRASGNVSSVTRNATGDFTINFTTAMQDANYAIVATSADSGTTNIWNNQAATSASAGYMTASSVRIATTVGGTQANTTIATVTVFR
jgi:hypothetical protein